MSAQPSTSSLKFRSVPCSVEAELCSWLCCILAVLTRAGAGPCHGNDTLFKVMSLKVHKVEWQLAILMTATNFSRLGVLRYLQLNGRLTVCYINDTPCMAKDLEEYEWEAVAASQRLLSCPRSTHRSGLAVLSCMSVQLKGELTARYGDDTVFVVKDLEEYKAEQQLASEGLAFFLMATYGDGEPTDNASEFYNWLIKAAGSGENACRLKVRSRPASAQCRAARATPGGTCNPRQHRTMTGSSGELLAAPKGASACTLRAASGRLGLQHVHPAGVLPSS